MNLRLRSELPLLEIQLLLTLQTSHLIHSTDLRSNHDLIGNILDRLPGMKLLISFGFRSCFNTLACSLDKCVNERKVSYSISFEKRKYRIFFVVISELTLVKFLLNRTVGSTIVILIGQSLLLQRSISAYSVVSP